jgi:hypothetical protein
MMLVVPPYTCARTLYQRAVHTQWQMMKGVLIAKALTLEPHEKPLADSADEYESAQGYGNMGAL